MDRAGRTGAREGLSFLESGSLSHRDGRLWLYYKVGPSPSQWAAGRKYSDDEGKTWSAEERLPAGLLGPIRAKPLVLDNGTIVTGSSVEAHETWAAWVERSADGGKTWAKIGPYGVARSGYR